MFTFSVTKKKIGTRLTFDPNVTQLATFKKGIVKNKTKKKVVYVIDNLKYFLTWLRNLDLCGHGQRRERNPRSSGIF